MLLAVNAFFVASEFAVISAKRSQIEPLAEEGKRSARVALGAMEHATLMLSTTQLGITVASLLILQVSEPAIHHLLEVPLGAIGLSEDVVGVIGFVLALLIVTFLHVVFGEMVPKNVAFSVPDRAVLMLAQPLVFVERVFRPLIFALNGVTNRLVRLVGVEPKDEANSTFTIDEVETIVQTSRREGTLADASPTLTAAFDFTEKQVQDVAVPLAEIVGLPEAATPADLERAVAQSGFSRYVRPGRGRRAGRLPAPEGRAEPGRGRRGRPARAREAGAPPALGTGGHGAGGRAGEHAAGRPAPLPRRRRGGHDPGRAVPGGRDRGAGGRGAGRHATRGVPPPPAAADPFACSICWCPGHLRP